MGKPSPPTPPNPLDTARAQTGTNVSTSVANAYLGNVNQNTPNGSLSYNATGNYAFTDPTTGQTYQIPTFTATQTLSPQGQAIQGQTQAAQLNLAGMANAQSSRISGLLSQGLDTNFNLQSYLANNPDVAQAVNQYMASGMMTGAQAAAWAQYHYENNGIFEGRSGGAPSGGDATNILNLPQAFTGFDPGGQIQQNLNLTGAADPSNIQSTYGPADNYSADRQRVEDSLMARMNPQLQIEKQGIQQQLADQGIRYGSQAYNDAMMNYSRQADDARFGAISQAGQEQQRMQQQAGQLAAFQNAAQQQGYEQAAGQGTFANQAQQQGFNQNAAQAQFANAGLAQQLQQQQAGFNAQQAALNQYLQQQYAQRNQPINEITSLLSGSQVQMPNFINTPGAQIPTTDVAGLVNQNFQNQLGIYQQQNAQYNSLVGGALGLGAGALKLSDRREKKDIDKIGTVLAAGADDDDRKMGTVFSPEARELPIYQYSYKDDPASIRHIGPMAQDMEKIDPEAVEQHGGRKYLKTSKVMGSILRAA